MSLREFWEMSPMAFELKSEGYLNQQNRARVYFRESFALLYNVNKGEKNPALFGPDVITLLGEKPKRQPRQPKRTVWTPEKIAEVQARINGQPWPPVDDSPTIETNPS